LCVDPDWVMYISFIHRLLTHLNPNVVNLLWQQKHQKTLLPTLTEQYRVALWRMERQYLIS